MSNQKSFDASEQKHSGRHYRQQATQFRQLAEDEPVTDLRAKLLDLAKDYDKAAEAVDDHTVLRARPVQGEIDYAKLSREHIARFPKIRAALAK